MQAERRYQAVRAEELGLKDEGIGKRYTEGDLYRFMYLAEEARTPACLRVILGQRELDPATYGQNVNFTTITAIEGMTLQEASSRLLVIRETGAHMALTPRRNPDGSIGYSSTTIGPKDKLALFDEGYDDLTFFDTEHVLYR